MPGETTPGLSKQLERKLFWRLIPFLFACYIVAFLDRVNVGLGAVQMNAALGLSPAIFGFGASLFFLGYFVFEIPSNMILAKVGARLWIPRIMITWGILAGENAFVTGETSFYVVRLLLGLAEAGFIPGVVLYLTYWFPTAVRARMLTWFLIGLPIAVVIGSPVSGALLQIDSSLGLKGWQWMFILEALPAVLLGVSAFWVLTDRPSSANWLTRAEKDAIERTLRAEEAGKEPPPANVFHIMFDPRVLLIGAANFLWAIGFYGLTLWLPQIIRSMTSLSTVEIGFVNAIPYLVGAIAMVLWARSSDHFQERHWHYAIATLVGAVGLLLSAWAPSPVLSLAAITFAMAGILGAFAVLFALPSSFLGMSAVGVGVATVATVGNSGGFFGPNLVAWMRSGFGTFEHALVGLALTMVGAGALVLIQHFTTRGQSARVDARAVVG